VPYEIEFSDNSLQFKEVDSPPLSSTHTIKYLGRKFTEFVLSDLKLHCTQIDGYFQSPKYFQRTSRNFVNFIRATLPQNDSSGSNTVLQVRLGDLAREPAIRKIHGYCTDTYWERALNLLEKHPIKTALVTDDILGIKKFLPNLNRYVHENNICISTNKIMDDLVLIANSDQRIISNSTFGWWGSYLATNSKTIAPKAWLSTDIFTPSSIDDLKMNDWIYV
jgi:hypothetical protein